MIFYLFIYLCLAIFSIFNRDVSYNRYDIDFSRVSITWFFILINFTLFLGFRHEIGPDWFSYVGYLNRASEFSFFDVFVNKDPGYQLINYLSNKLGTGIYGVNLVGGLIFSLGLVIFCLKQSRPYLAITISFPYLYLIIGMGYTRQSIAIGLVMMAISHLKNSKTNYSIFLLLLASTMHKSAVLMLPLFFLILDTNRYVKYFSGFIITIVAYALFLDNHVDELMYVYVESERYDSSGAFIRLLMSLIPSCIFLLYRDRFHFAPLMNRLWTVISLLSLFLTVLLFFSNLSTAIDRVALYLLPIQIVIFSSLPNVFTNVKKYRVLIILTVIFYYLIILLVWFGLSSHASAWSPYVFYPFWYLNN